MAFTTFDQTQLASGIPTSKISGTTTNDSAAAGYLGQYVNSTAGVTNAPASDTYGDLTSVSLSAGDWDVTGMTVADGNAAGGYSRTDVGISTTSGNSTSGLTLGDTLMATNTPPASHCPMTVSSVRMSFASTTTVYLKMRATYSSGTPQYRGSRLSARRVR
jgi:hypothetical protein